MAANMADGLSVQVLCAYKVSSIYDFNHRLAYYIALATVLLVSHRWIRPAALAFVVLYSMFSTLYVAALSLAPNRLGPSLDVFALNSIMLTNCYGLAAAVFCRKSIMKGKRGWAAVVRAFVWIWAGFVAASMAKSSFERFASDAAVEVQCFSENATNSAANIFSIGNGMACENPCDVPAASVAHRLQEQLSPIVWGSLDKATNSFSKMPIPTLSMSEYAVVILFAVALASTLWINFFTSVQITRNTIFAALTQGKTDSRVRVSLAKVAALTWYTWSYFALLLVALACPFVSYVQEQILVRYPVEKNSCLMKQWLPWVVGVAIFLVKIAVWRKKREAWSKEKACRIRRFNTALRTLQGGNEAAHLLPEHHHQHVDEKTAPVVTEQAMTPSRPATPVPGLQQAKKHRIEIAETRKVRGFKDTAVELKEWWKNPMGTKEEASTADEEKALLKGHY